MGKHVSDFLIPTVCPSCKKPVVYYSNPYHLFEHAEKEGGCGYKGSHDDLLVAFDLEGARAYLAQCLGEINDFVEQYPTLQDLQKESS